MKYTFYGISNDNKKQYIKSWYSETYDDWFITYNKDNAMALTLSLARFTIKNATSVPHIKTYKIINI